MDSSQRTAASGSRTAAVANPMFDDTECSVCHQGFTKPRLLNCMHTFCQSCLENRPSPTKRDNFHIDRPPMLEEFEALVTSVCQKEVTCPICRAVTPLRFGGISALPTNHLANKIAAYANLRNKEPRCDTCCNDGLLSRGKRRLVESTYKYCTSCEQRLCEPCSAVHRKIRLTKRHQLIDVESAGAEDRSKLIKRSVNYCVKHADELLSMYCKWCRTPICSLCMADRVHSAHECVHIDVADVDIRTELAEHVESLTAIIERRQTELEEVETNRVQNIRTALRDKYTTVKSEIEQRALEVCEQVKEQEKWLLERLSAWHDKELEHCDKERIECQRCIAECTALVKYAKSCSDHGTSADIALVNNDLRRRETLELVDIEQRNSLLGLYDISKIRFNPEPNPYSLIRSGGDLMGQLMGIDLPDVDEEEDGGDSDTEIDTD